MWAVVCETSRGSRAAARSERIVVELLSTARSYWVLMFVRSCVVVARQQATVASSASGKLGLCTS